MKIAKITTQIHTISPTVAQELLGRSEGNRSLKRTKLDSYASDMRAGKWVMNGEPIIIDEDGTLVDGHHRLTAVIDADCSIKTLVVYGVSRNSRFTIDMGASRTVGDVLSFEGVKNANLVSSIARNLMALEIGRPRSANPSSQELLEYIEKHPEIYEAASFASHHHMKRCGTMMGSAFVVDPVAATLFGDVLKTGVPEYSGCAAHRFREVVMASEMGRGRTNMTLRDLQLLFISAFEKFRKGIPVKALKKASEYKMTGWPK